MERDAKGPQSALVGIILRPYAEAPRYTEQDELMGIRIETQDVQHGHEEDEEDKEHLGDSSIRRQSGCLHAAFITQKRNIEYDLGHISH